MLAACEGIGRIALDQGWLDQAGFDAIVTDIKRWSERPDAVGLMVICETLGWVTKKWVRGRLARPSSRIRPRKIFAMRLAEYQLPQELTVLDPTRDYQRQSA